MQLPKEVRELVRFASDAVNAYMRGRSIPAVALNYCYEPVTAIVMLRHCCRWYGSSSVEAAIPRHIFLLVVGASDERRGRK